MRSYDSNSSQMLSDPFITALDGFVQQIEKDSLPVTVTDIYIGYLDTGKDDPIKASWLAKTSDKRIFSYSNESEVATP